MIKNCQELMKHVPRILIDMCGLFITKCPHISVETYSLHCHFTGRFVKISREKFNRKCFLSEYY